MSNTWLSALTEPVLLQDAEHNWQFDVFAFAEATPGVTLSLLGFHFHRVAGFIQEFDLDATKLFSFLQRIEQGYVAANPYHNRFAKRLWCQHATTVMLWSCSWQRPTKL